jgi:phosphonate transport system ATP-binding protein
MMELLGVGVPRSEGGWLLHRVCARFEGAGLVVVVSRRPGERRALLDTVAGRSIPHEGRVWVDGVPATRSTKGRLRELVREVELPALLIPHRSILWNVLAYQGIGSRALGPLLRLPRLGRREAALRALERVDLDSRSTDPVSGLDPEATARVALARALLPGSRYLLLREPDRSLDGLDLDRFLTRVAALARRERLTVLTSLGWSDAASHVASRVVALTDGLLVFDGPPSALARLDRWPGSGHVTKTSEQSEPTRTAVDFDGSRSSIR